MREDEGGKRSYLSGFLVESQWALRDISMSRDKNCRETIFVSQLSRSYPHRGGYLERGEKNPLLWGRDSLGGILVDNLGEGNCESKLSRGIGETIFATRHQDGPRRARIWKASSGAGLAKTPMLNVCLNETHCLKSTRFQNLTKRKSGFTNTQGRTNPVFSKPCLCGETIFAARHQHVTQGLRICRA